MVLPFWWESRSLPSSNPLIYFKGFFIFLFYMENLDFVIRGIMSPYLKRVTDVKKIISSMKTHNLINDENEIQNDHIAFRTLGYKNLGIESLEKIFLYFGYTKKDFFNFKNKKLNAFWYSPPDEKYPRVFISELRINELSSKNYQIIQNYISSIKEDPVDNLDFNNLNDIVSFFKKPLWELPTFKDYKKLLNESEYAAWVIYNRYYLNHYTMSIHMLNKKNNLEGFNFFLERIGIKLNTSGGKIKESKDGLLRQSSTVSKLIPATFACGITENIPGSYVEFAERLPLPQFKNLPDSEIKSMHRRDGFEAGNADKIFESTYTSQIREKN